jgi:hypothetical protein
MLIDRILQISVTVKLFDTGTISGKSGKDTVRVTG